ncbi:MAG: SUMF1/EgtB/PvdO family nonheme iron enzyme [Deltaproteobacteria bacterium]|nr:SUMF1/EgtB/PvdO family nonheme iron enzyme [Deltaproteobacteria bacterium]
MVEVPAGVVLLGSWPGTKGRDAVREIDLVPTAFAAFAIDRLPYPDDPAQDAATNVTRQEAERRCEEAGKRLCTEVEWEAACKGPQSQTYPYGDDYDAARYAPGETLAGSLGVLGMTGLYEWTAGDWMDPKGVASPNVAPLRGAPPGEDDAAARHCAARTGLDPARASPRAGFRCCRGQGHPLPYQVDPIKRAVRAAPLLNDAMLARLVRSIPELRRVWGDPRIQSDGVQTQALLRSGRTETSGIGFAITIQPVYWIPAQGDELMAIVGRSGHDVFTAALYTTGIPDLYVHAASMVLTNVGDDDGVALFGGLRDRKLLGWGECDDCRDGGSFEYHEEDRTITVGHRW